MVKRSRSGTNRDKMIATADELIYHKGFFSTSFGDIAEAAGVSKGNFYHYFRSKEEMLAAIVEARAEAMRERLAQWEAELPEPRARLKRFVDILKFEQENIADYGCPMGSLNMELGKNDKALQADISDMMSMVLDWLTRQFRALGRGREARYLAMQLMSATQGASVMTNVYMDKTFLRKEIKRLKQWLDEL